MKFNDYASVIANNIVHAQRFIKGKRCIPGIGKIVSMRTLLKQMLMMGLEHRLVRAL
jgi:hypothetical protein